jgi:integrase
VWHDFFYLELTTGLRLGEICGLKWEDFDEKKGTLKIQRSIGRTVNGKNITVGDPKTEKGKRMIKLPDSTFQVLLRRKEKYKGDWMFPSIKYPGKPVAPSGAYHRHKQILQDLELPSIRFHDLRHTFATHAIKSGVDAKTLSGILGHTNASFTLDTYTHVTNDMQFRASEIVGDFMEEIL